MLTLEYRDVSLFFLLSSVLARDLTLEETVPVVPPLQLPVLPSPDVLGSPLPTPTSPALSDDSDCLFRLDVDNVRSLLPQDTTALPPVLRITNEGTCSNEILISRSKNNYHMTHTAPRALSLLN